MQLNRAFDLAFGFPEGFRIPLDTIDGSIGLRPAHAHTAGDLYCDRHRQCW
jgi:hypothetical protein